MKRAARRKKPRKSRSQEQTLPFSFVTRDGKTTTRHFEGRRVIRIGEVDGKKVSRLELFTAREAHYLSVRFQDQTVLSLEITPLFTLKTELYRVTSGDPETVKKWAEIRSER